VKGSVKPFRKGIRTATGQLTTSTMSGDVEVFLLQPHGGTRKLTLKDVLFVSDIKINLLGTIRLGKRGIGVNLLPNEVVLTHTPTMDDFGYGDIIHDQYLLRIDHRGVTAAVAAGKEPTSAEETYGHHDKFYDWVNDEVIRSRLTDTTGRNESPKTYTTMEQPPTQLNVTTRKGTTTTKESTKESLKYDDFLDDLNTPASNEKEEQSEPADDSSTGDNGKRLDKRRVNIQT
jgi:hypothetical protein